MENVMTPISCNEERSSS